MATRELKHPEFEIEDDDEDLRIRFRVPGSTFGAVEVLLSADEAEQFVASLEQAVAFCGARLGDSDG